MSHNQTMSSFSGSKRDARSSRLKRSTHRFLKGGGFCRNRESIRRASPSRVFGLVRGVLLSPWLLALVCLWTGGENVSVSQAAEAGGVVRVEQIYDADGQRVGKRVVTLDPDTGLSHTNEQRFLLEGLNPTGYAQVSGVIGRESGQGWRVTQRSLHGQGLVGTATRRSEAVPGQAGGWQIRHAMADGHGSVRQESGEEALDRPRIYTAWGEDVGVGGLRDDVGIGWGYAGEVWDGALGMYELRARQYRPTTGRFWTMDRFEGRTREPLSLHKYLYAHNNPVNGIDPSGHSMLGDVMLSVSTRVWMFTQSTAPIATAAKAGLATLTLAAALNNPAEFVSALESPFAAANLLAADVAFVAYYGKRTAQFAAGYISVRTQVQPVVEEVLGAAALRIKQFDQNAVIGFRGSVARGYKGPQKSNDPFDPSNFDVDGFIVSDKLAAQIPKTGPGRFVTRQNSPALAAEQTAIDQQLREKLKGLKNEPFGFRVFTYEEYLTKANDGTFVGGQ